MKTTTQLLAELSLCEQGLEVGGQRFEPDATKAYCEIKLSHSWPVRTYYGEALHPATVSKSFRSLLHQPVNRDHQMRVHDPERIIRDRIVGTVVAVEFPPAPPTGWRLPASEAEAPGIRAAVSLFKQAEWVDKFLGQHQSGRLPFTVSMEVLYVNADSGFMVESDPGTIAPGWDYISFNDAPPELLATRDWKRNRMTARAVDGRYAGRWGNREVYWLMGGIGGPVHYNGVGVVEYGAEPTARIGRVLAAVSDEEAEAAAAAFESLRILLTNGPRSG